MKRPWKIRVQCARCDTWHYLDATYPTIDDAARASRLAHGGMRITDDSTGKELLVPIREVEVENQDTGDKVRVWVAT